MHSIENMPHTSIDTGIAQSDRRRRCTGPRGGGSARRRCRRVALVDKHVLVMVLVVLVALDAFRASLAYASRAVA